MNASCREGRARQRVRRDQGGRGGQRLGQRRTVPSLTTLSLKWQIPAQKRPDVGYGLNWTATAGPIAEHICLESCLVREMRAWMSLGKKLNDV
jgi:hypothetical protein